MKIFFVLNVKRHQIDTGGFVLGDFYRFDPTKKEWTKVVKETAPPARVRAGMVGGADGRIYVVGGGFYVGNSGEFPFC